jgi:hypothetical protein
MQTRLNFDEWQLCYDAEWPLGEFGPYQSEVAWPVLYIDVAKNFERQIRKMFVIVGNQKRTCKVNVRVQGTFAPLFR